MSNTGLIIAMVLITLVVIAMAVVLSVFVSRSGGTGGPGPIGPTGPPGPPNGPPGPAGPTGPKGDVGQPGQNGTNGVDGQPGQNGTNGINGQQGPAGPTGSMGPLGRQGVPGPTGSAGPPGPPGPTGPIGPQGPAGGLTGVMNEQPLVSGSNLSQSFSSDLLASFQTVNGGLIPLNATSTFIFDDITGLPNGTTIIMRLNLVINTNNPVLTGIVITTPGQAQIPVTPTPFNANGTTTVTFTIQKNTTYQVLLVFQPPAGTNTINLSQLHLMTQLLFATRDLEDTQVKLLDHSHHGVKPSDHAKLNHGSLRSRPNRR